MRLQTRQVHENIRTALRALGGSMADILSLTQHVTDIEAFMTTGDIRSEFFAPPYPATTTVQVVRLFRPDLVVEITALAEIPRDRFRRPAG
jgi:enamine deaminase RidA (YjgF/YER057c/UK114 family)